MRHRTFAKRSRRTYHSCVRRGHSSKNRLRGSIEWQTETLGHNPARAFPAAISPVADMTVRNQSDLTIGGFIAVVSWSVVTNLPPREACGNVARPRSKHDRRQLPATVGIRGNGLWNGKERGHGPRRTAEAPMFLRGLRTGWRRLRRSAATVARLHDSFARIAFFGMADGHKGHHLKGAYQRKEAGKPRGNRDAIEAERV